MMRREALELGDFRSSCGLFYQDPMCLGEGNSDEGVEDDNQGQSRREQVSAAGRGHSEKTDDGSERRQHAKIKPEQPKPDRISNPAMKDYQKAGTHHTAHLPSANITSS